METDAALLEGRIPLSSSSPAVRVTGALHVCALFRFSHAWVQTFGLSGRSATKTQNGGRTNAYIHTRARACAQASLEKLRKRKDSREDHGPCSLINFVSCGRVIQARLTCKFKHQAWLYSVWAERRYTILWASFFVCIQVAARRRGTCQAREAWSGSIRNSCFSLYLL